jgi:hypothetical protein
LAVNSAYKITGMLDSYHARPFLTMFFAAADHPRMYDQSPALDHVRSGELMVAGVPPSLAAAPLYLPGLTRLVGGGALLSCERLLHGHVRITEGRLLPDQLAGHSSVALASDWT